MKPQTFLLYDPLVETIPAVSARLDARETGIRLAGGNDWSLRHRQLRGGRSDGVDVIELCSGALTVSVLPTRGMGIWKAECHGVNVGWASPVRQPVHPRHVELAARNGLGWLDGFNELLCRCGLAFNGPPGNDADARSPIESQLTLHGRIANLPAHRVELGIDPSGPGRLSVTGVVDECTLFGPQLRLTSTVAVDAGARTIEIVDRVENLGSTPTELELLYHINVGPPFLDAGAKLVAPAATIVPRDPRAAEGIDTHDTFLGPTAGYAEQAYFYDLLADERGWATALLHNASAKVGLQLDFDKARLPYFTLWKCTQPEADGYVTGLEPGTNFPNFKGFERRAGRVLSLSPGEVHECRMQLEVLVSATAVEAAVHRLTARQQGQDSAVLRQPGSGFAPEA